MEVLLVEPGKEARIAEIGNDLKMCIRDRMLCVRDYWS